MAAKIQVIAGIKALTIAKLLILTGPGQSD
jgi:hypothetical protein